MTLSARDLLTPNVLRVSAEARPADYHRETVGSRPLVFAVFEQETFLGLVDAQAVLHHPERIFLDLCHPTSPPSIADTTPLEQILAEMERQQRDVLSVINADGHFPGVVTRVGITNALLTRSQARRRREREQAERTLHQLSQALEQTADNVIITGRDGVITYVNPAFEQLTSYTPAEAVGQTPRLLKSGQHDARFYQGLWRTLLRGAVFRGIFMNRKKDGEIYYEEKTITPLRDQAGHVTHFVSTGRDITMRQRLEEEAERQRREAEVLAALAHSLNTSLELDTILPYVAEGARDLCRGDAASIALREPGGKAAVVRYRVGKGSEFFKDLRIDPDNGLGGQVLRTGCPARTKQYATDPRPNPDQLRIAHEAGTMTLLVVPIMIGTWVEGLLYVTRSSPQPFTNHDEEILQRLGDHAAVAIHNARPYAEAQQRQWIAESLAEVNYLLLQALDPAEVGQWIVDSIRGLLQAQTAALYRWEPEADALVALATAGDISFEQGQSLAFPRGTGLSWLAMQQREPVATPDVLADPRVTLTPAQRARLEKAAYRAVLVVPLRIGARVIGTLVIADRLGRSYDQEAIELAQAFADQGATALHNAQLYAEVQDSRARPGPGQRGSPSIAGVPSPRNGLLSHRPGSAHERATARAGPPGPGGGPAARDRASAVHPG